VRDLRPHELDELGLTAAVTAAAARFEGLGVRVAGTGLPGLPPVVEIAAYRIAMEALTNAARHAGACTARVRFEVDGGALVVTVTDDGRGLTATGRPGTGMGSMRERAHELGGTFAVTTPATGGTHVCAVLPLVVMS